MFTHHAEARAKIDAQGLRGKAGGYSRQPPLLGHPRQANIEYSKNGAQGRSHLRKRDFESELLERLLSHGPRGGKFEIHELYWHLLIPRPDKSSISVPECSLMQDLKRVPRAAHVLETVDNPEN